MKQFNTIALLACLLAIGLFSCQKELHFPEAPPVSQFTVEVNGKTYYLNIKQQNVKIDDTAHIQIKTNSPEISVSLNFMSTTHVKGIGTYYLKCCTNDVYDRTTGTQKHWEIDHISGGLQNGTVIINRMDDKGYAGSFTIYGNDYEISRSAKKEFKGTFDIVY